MRCCGSIDVTAVPMTFTSSLRFESNPGFVMKLCDHRLFIATIRTGSPITSRCPNWQQCQLPLATRPGVPEADDTATLEIWVDQGESKQTGFGSVDFAPPWIQNSKSAPSKNTSFIFKEC
jgi:hypothetical protein